MTSNISIHLFQILELEKTEILGQKTIHFFPESQIFDTCIKKSKSDNSTKERPGFSPYKRGCTIYLLFKMKMLSCIASALFLV